MYANKTKDSTKQFFKNKATNIRMRFKKKKKEIAKVKKALVIQNNTITENKLDVLENRSC